MKNTPLTLLARLAKAFTPGGNPIQNDDGIPIHISANGTSSIADKDLARYLECAMNKEFKP